MSYVFAFAASAIVVTMALALFRATRGPTTFDRILALNMFGTGTVLLIAVVGFLFERPEWTDLAMIYGLCNFIGVLAVLRFSKYGSFDDEVEIEQPSMRPEEWDQ